MVTSSSQIINGYQLMPSVSLDPSIAESHSSNRHLMGVTIALCAVVLLGATTRASVMHLSSLQSKHNVNIHTKLVTIHS